MYTQREREIGSRRLRARDGPLAVASDHFGPVCALLNLLSSLNRRGIGRADIARNNFKRVRWKRFLLSSFASERPLSAYIEVRIWNDFPIKSGHCPAALDAAISVVFIVYSC